jgi:CBS domain-containing protein
MKVADIMIREVITIHEDASIEELCDLLQEKNIKGVPVVDNKGRLMGIVSMDDIVYGRMGHMEEETAVSTKEKCVAKIKERSSKATSKTPIKVSDIMTSPPIFADEESDCIDICNTMWKFRIHRIPVVRDEVVTGMISALDFCKAIATGRIKLE